MNRSSNLKTPFLYGLIGSVLLGAVLGIIAVLRNTWHWFEVQVMLTTVIVAVSSLCGLACDSFRTPKGMNLMPKAGLAFVGMAAALLLTGVWGEVDSEEYWKATICVCIIAVAIVHVGLLSIAKLASRFQWVYLVGSQIIFGFALLLCATVIGQIESSEVWRLIAALSIVVAAISLVIPILHRISRMGSRGDTLQSPVVDRNLASIDDEIGRLQIRIAELQRLKETMTS
ncbi:hypothetical protein K227x_02300 [Rubripirellula lacrimiformis]|uniref:Uncharacterized protein n=1 Tax=Rubripirellula lacrimiformis TaxID=1930273 RepID=A0A517N400_9BACT|nr:hypothetical protein [Rubripirellula lacrimiformis]QDT01861.1 hypothetical protein K227x_02300 [Rubripirellula lacrimiformis]